MHIPDGYLSPSTCATLYAAATPFWVLALRRVKNALTGQTVPLLAVFASFSFVVMMFNLPLPGGTTGHAVGMAMAAIILGPEFAIVAVSMALLLQAVFFGDGGITAFGANCFNMAVVGSLVAYGVYRVLAGRSPLESKRRVIAAGLAGYLAINASAFCAAVEFGVQPLWFHDSTGAPLYAPYPLSIAVPAMMIGHLTVAGLAEMVLTAGLIAYLQTANPELLSPAKSPQSRSLRTLWVALCVLVVLTPLGLLAAGTAWGEWQPQALLQPPSGLLALSKLWRAPFAEYAPSFVTNNSLGYLLSALIGVALLIAIAFFAQRPFVRSARRRNAFVEKTMSALLSTVEQALFAENTAQLNGFLQKLDPRVKIAGFGALLGASLLARRLEVLGLLLGIGILCALASQIPLQHLAIRVWLSVLLFTGLIAVPAIFLEPHGWRSAAFLILRAEIAATFSVLLVLTTVWSRLLRSLRFLRVPAAAVAVLSMSYRYVFVFVESARQTLEARQTRLVGRLEPALERRLAAASVGTLLAKSIGLASEVYSAMQARGFRGEVRLLDDLSMRARDWCYLAALIAAAALLAGWGRQ